MTSTTNDYHVILFYKYTPLSSKKDVMAIYQSAMKSLCTSLELTGRVLIGLSNNAEGINGTLAGKKENVLLYTYAMLGKIWCMENKKLQRHETNHGTNGDHDHVSDQKKDTHCDILETFFEACEQFSKVAKVPEPTIDSPEDFKWSSVDDSTNSNNQALFPDLQIKLVKEIISTGGVLSSVSIQETSKDYLTPEEWHHEIKNLDDKDNNTILIDCRNHKEFAVGHFQHAIDPNTKNFAQFPRWVKENKSSLKDKKVLMYCTGGIRCEKASAFIRNELKDVSTKSSVYHLKGGIHKYLDQYASDGYFRGKNFVFDRRLAVDAVEHKKNDILSVSGESSNDSQNNKNIVGKCQYCEKHHDNFTGDGVCTVCRELALVCDECKSKLDGEYHCMDHMHLKNCYFTNLGKFNSEQLQSQLEEVEGFLNEIAVGRRYKQRRQTLHKQCDRIRERIANISKDDTGILDKTPPSCRSCGEASCRGECWGVHGLKRKKYLDKETKESSTKTPRLSSNNRQSKVAQKQKEIDDINRLKLSDAPNVHRNKDTGLRCPPPCIRVLSSSVKGKWCGKTLRSVLASEFHDFSDSSRLDEIFKRSLVQINGVPVNSDEALRRGTDANKALSPDTLLKNMDIISRVQHWHEPPVVLPDHINVECTELPQSVCDELMPNSQEGSSDDIDIYCCNKPSTVPVHPAGPYYQNTLLLMVEAQEGLKPRSLLPCHRLDRCTSGLTICCTNPKIARLFQIQMDLKAVSKMYLARVKGQFPENDDDCKETLSTQFEMASWSWCSKNNCVEFDAPIGITDVQSGIRVIKESGKSSKSRFKLLNYDKMSNISTISCFPMTGRQHQLRVHLQALGFPIHNDVSYGGTIEAKCQNEMRSKSIQAINDAIKNDRSCISLNDKVTEELIQQAKEFCLCCQGNKGIGQSFNSAHLLDEGHAIDLHALAYRIKFGKKRKKVKSGETSKDEQPLAVMEFTVTAPSWIDAGTVPKYCWLDV